MKDITVLYVQPNILHSFVLELKSMEVKASQTGTSMSTSEPRLRIENLTIDGDPWLHMSMSMVLIPVLNHNQRYHSQCAAAAMMHGNSMAQASSLHGGCPPIAEHQEYSQSSAPPGMVMMQHDASTPNPDYKIAANLWDLNIAQCARAPSPLSTFICHCNTMESPHFPTYSK